MTTTTVLSEDSATIVGDDTSRFNWGAAIAGALIATAVTFLLGGAAVGVPFFLWVGVFNYTAIAQFWAFAADLHGAEQGKRIFPVLGIGSSVGAVAGARIAKSMFFARLPSPVRTTTFSPALTRHSASTSRHKRSR